MYRPDDAGVWKDDDSQRSRSRRSFNQASQSASNGPDTSKRHANHKMSITSVSAITREKHGCAQDERKEPDTYFFVVFNFCAFAHSEKWEGSDSVLAFLQSIITPEAYKGSKNKSVTKYSSNIQQIL